MVKNKIKILLIEDEEDMIDMYKTKFEMKGYSMPIARTVKEAIEKIKKEKPDLVLLDIVLGKEEPIKENELYAGFHILEKMKKDPNMKHIPVVIISNLGGKEHMLRGLRLGADDYLIKSKFIPEQVVKRVEKVLAKHIII